MDIQSIKIQFCSLFPEIDFSQETDFCTFEPYFVSNQFTEIRVAGTYKRLNRKGQTQGHKIQTHVRKQYKLVFLHEQSLNIELLQTSDNVLITDSEGYQYDFTDCSITTEFQPNNKYKTSVVGFIMNEQNEACNVSSDYVLAKNIDSASNLVNYLEVTVNKPSYYGVSDFTDGGTKAEFTLAVDDYTDNIAVNDYLYFHADFDFRDMGLSAVKCTAKTSSTITFEGSTVYNTFTAQSDKHFTLNYEPAYSTDGSVSESAITTKIYTDFIPNFNSVTTGGGKEIEVAQGKELVTRKTVTRNLTVPLIVIDSELWKIEQIYKADSIKFVAQTGTYYAFRVDGILAQKANTQLFGVKEYELVMPYFQEVINRNH